MTARRMILAGLTGFASAGLFAPHAAALLNLDEGRNKIMLSSSVTYGYDSNLFASSGGGGDTYANASMSLGFSRHAGLLGLDGSVGLSANRYGKFTGENFENPNFNAVVSKNSGRTQGSLSLNAARQSRADAASNLRNEAWAYSASLSLNYRVIERYSFKPTFSYSLNDFMDNTTAVDLESFSAGLDLFYIYSATRDLLGSYRFRIEETAAGNRNYDHAFSFGMSGKIFSGFTGQVRAGYEVRIPTGTNESTYRAWTANANVGWTLTKRLSVNAQLAKDFSTTSTNVSVDALSLSTGGQYALNSKTSLSAGTGWSHSRFLGPTAGGRVDSNWTWNVALSRTISRNNRGSIKGNLGYSFTRNWSNASVSNFDRSNATVTISSAF